MPPRKPRTDDLISPFPIKRWDFYGNARRIEENVLQGAGVGGGTGGGPFPKDPIWGFVTSVGDATHPATIQLYNPVGSLVNLLVYELYMSLVTHASTSPLFGKLTDTPTTLSAPNLANLIHLDSQSIAPIHGILGGWTTGAAPTILTEATGEFPWSGVLEGATGFSPYPIRGPGEFPIIIVPGDALEFTADTNSAGTKIRAQVAFDEEATT